MNCFKFCPYCKGGLKETKNQYRCRVCKREIFKNSSPTASVFIVKEGRVLLAKRGIPPHRGTYDIPGGFLNWGEDPEKGAVREIKEETGLDVKLTALLGIYPDDYLYQGKVVKVLGIFYIGKIVRGKMVPQDDIERVDWFPIAKPPKNIAFKSVKKGLSDLAKRAKL